ncbi:MAG: PGPGW domain-containing protein [Actinobacteria bacterium]|nr:PGPGW domain-containing protein [Actinomycetota bacterium]
MRQHRHLGDDPSDDATAVPGSRIGGPAIGGPANGGPANAGLAGGGNRPPAGSDHPAAGTVRRFDELRAAARRAEEAVGDPGRGEAATSRRLAARIAVIVGGGAVAVAGLAMLVLPGPGLVLVVIGLGLMAQEVAWAERLLSYLKRRARVDRLERQPRWVKLAAVVGALAATTAGTVWALAG